MSLQEGTFSCPGQCSERDQVRNHQQLSEAEGMSHDSEGRQEGAYSLLYTYQGVIHGFEVLHITLYSFYFSMSQN